MNSIPARGRPKRLSAYAITSRINPWYTVSRASERTRSGTLSEEFSLLDLFGKSAVSRYDRAGLDNGLLCADVRQKRMTVAEKHVSIHAPKHIPKGFVDRCDHASSPRSIVLTQLDVFVLAVASSREEFHLQDRVYAGRTNRHRPLKPPWRFRFRHRGGIDRSLQAPS